MTTGRNDDLLARMDRVIAAGMGLGTEETREVAVALRESEQERTRLRERLEFWWKQFDKSFPDAWNLAITRHKVETLRTQAERAERLGGDLAKALERKADPLGVAAPSAALAAWEAFLAEATPQPEEGV